VSHQHPTSTSCIFFKLLLLYWMYIVTFTEVLTIYHSWVRPLHHSPLSPPSRAVYSLKNICTLKIRPQEKTGAQSAGHMFLITEKQSESPLFQIRLVSHQWYPSILERGQSWGCTGCVHVGCEYDDL
jgi:hypothetical protein